MSNQNPRPELMSRLKSICKNLDKKTLELEQETSVPYTRMVKGPYASNFADALLDDTKKMAGQVDQTSQVIKGEADNLESFLETTMAQFQDHLEEVGQIERYMAQYGYKPLPPLPPEVVDWRTPPAAADLTPESLEERRDDNVPEASGRLDQIKLDVNMKGTESPPSIFELGLSKQTLESVVGKSARIKPLAEVKNAVIEENESILQNETIEMTVNASPVLRLTSRLKACNTSLDASSSYTIANTTDTDTSQVEITPGLMVRRPGSSLRNRQSQATTPNEPILSTVSLVKNKEQKATTPNQPSLAYKAKPCEEESTTPSEPNLTTQVKKKVITPSTPTTTAKIEFSPDGTPVMPTLKTVNLNAFNLSKPVSDEKKNEAAKPLVFQTKENVEFGSKSSVPSFLPKTPLQKFKKEVIPGTPETPELVTMDIRKLISNAMGLKQNQDQRVADKTTPTEPKLTVPISIPDSKGDALGCRSTPEEPELKGIVSSSRIVQNVGGLDDTPELPELSIMADRTTMREDSLTPDTPVFSNHTLGRFQK